MFFETTRQEDSIDVSLMRVGGQGRPLCFGKTQYVSRRDKCAVLDRRCKERRKVEIFLRDDSHELK